MGIFGDFDIRLDPWEVEYGPEFPLNVADEPDGQDVDVDVEVPADEWKPIVPANADHFATTFFVDGVRRVEAKLLVRRNELLLHGAFLDHAGGVRAAVEFRRAITGVGFIGTHIVVAAEKLMSFGAAE